MRSVHVDVETTSKASLTSTTTRVGSDAYARHESTDLWCVSWQVEGEPDVHTWVPGEPTPEVFQGEYIVLAHNYRFEQAIFESILVPQYGFAKPKGYRCTMAMCAYHNLPMALANIADRLKLPERKDTDISRMMVRMANANRYDPSKEGSTAHKNHSENIKLLIAYCEQDVRTEHAVADYFTFSNFPLDQFLLDQEINDRGIKVDVQAAKAINRAVEKEVKRLNSELKLLTGGAVSTGRQQKKLLTWMQGEGYPHESLSEECVTDALKDPGNLTMDGLMALDIRKRLALGSIAKYGVMIRNVDNIDRLHGMFQFLGASQTGRWAGRLVQLQNLPRLSLDDETVDKTIELFIAGETDQIIESLGMDILSAAKQMIRPMFIAAEGHQLVVSDLAQIECRVLAWLAGEQEVLDTFAAGRDLYALMASKIFKKPVDKCGKGTKERQLGKAAVLGCGFGLGATGFAQSVWSMERVELSQSEAKFIVDEYRSANPKVTHFWSEVDTAMRSLVHEPDRVNQVGRLTFWRQGDCIYATLPSGRSLHYWEPKLEKHQDGGEQFTFLAATGNRNKLWRGLITENVVQAVARDILTDRMLTLRDAGYSIVGHVHDEAILEVPEESLDTKSISQIMSSNPPWADGIPLAAETAAGTRYTK